MPLIVRASLLGWFATAIVGAVLAVSAATSQQPVTQPAADGESGAPVTLEREAVTLEELLAALSKQADLKLSAGRGIRWDQVTLRVKRRSARRVMAELAELLNCTWEREERQHVLNMGTRARAFEENLRRRWFGGAVDELLDYAALAKRPPEYYLRLKEAVDRKQWLDPRLRQGVAMTVLTTPGQHATLQLLLTLSRDQLLSLISEQQYYLRWEEMNPIQRELALQIANYMETNGYLSRPSESILPGARQWVQEMGLVLQNSARTRSPHPSRYEVYIGRASVEGGAYITSRSASPQGLVETRGNPYPPRDPRRARSAAAGSREYEDLEGMPFPARGFRQTYPSTWPEVFRQLAERLPFALYSDYFPVPPIGWAVPADWNPREETGNPPIPPLEKMSLAQGLDALCARYGKVWWRRGDALFFRSRTWFLDRLYQVPPPVLKALRQKFRTLGRLDRQGIDLLAGLTRRQLSGIGLLTEEELNGSPRGYLEHQMYLPLRVFALFTQEQKARALSEAGVPFRQMTPTQQRAYREALFLMHRPVEELKDPPPFRFEQAVIPGVPGRKPSLGEVAVFLVDEVTRREQPRRHWDRLGDLYIAFPAERSETENTERRE